MDVSCPACAAKYTADEEKLRGKTARMRCKACNTAWMVSGPGVSAAPAAPSSVAPGADAEAKRAKTGNERERRDLFAARGADDIHGSVNEAPKVSSQAKDTLLPPPSFGFAGGTGSRNENSVLFRVDQLGGLGGARIKTPEPESLAELGRAKPQMAMAAPTPRGSDEEGVIDLKALASVPPPGKRSIIPVAPLFSEPPPALAFDSSGPSASRPAIAKPISKGKLFGAIAAAAAFLVVAGLGISVAFKGEEPVKHAAAAPAAPPPPPAPTAEKPPEPPAEKTASNDDDTAPKKATKKGKRKGGKAGGSSTAAAPQTKKAADPCGCKGDFNCILACTAKNGR
ncbi:MAG: zinc-ribbon domain-containing protein [Labilithrix sp.]|nr:zinc-ribbon domain-containing protein [Labilithrix sp.]MCW5816245.1 zinc-ribbon domain-containing protein [Labilithrix sp.]